MRIGASGCTCSSYVVHVVISECVFFVLARVPLDVDRENPRGKSSWQINMYT